MKQGELPKCPTCGASPEYSIRGPKWDLYRGSLRPPCNHHYVILESPAGSREKAMNSLAESWCELVREMQGDAQ